MLNKALEARPGEVVVEKCADPQLHLAIQERDKEIRLYKCLLQIRDKQLMEVQATERGSTRLDDVMLTLKAERDSNINLLIAEVQNLRQETLEMVLLDFCCRSCICFFNIKNTVKYLEFTRER